MSQDSCIFCKIAAGAIPATRVYEDEHLLAFMDIGPIIHGHTLVIPKQHSETLLDTPADTLDRMFRLAQKIAAAQKTGLQADGSNVIQNNGRVAGQAVPHIHIHVIPRFKNDGHHWNWAAKKYGAPEEMNRLADAIRKALPA